MAKAKINFLSNKEILLEIHRSKVSYSYFVDKIYSNYDFIVSELSEVNETFINEARQKKADGKMQESRQEQKLAGIKPYKIKVENVALTELPVSGLVLRRMTNEHMPPIPTEKLKPSQRELIDVRFKPNFPPYKHYVIEYSGNEDDETIDMSKVVFKEVGRSHWKNGLDNGEFCDTHGNITDRLARMFLELTQKYSQKPNWRGYSYIDEMRNQALMQLIQAGLKFDESKGQNPFAYYTTTMTTSFTGVFNKEKKNQMIRDSILMSHGYNPSSTRLIEHEMANKDNK